MHSRHSSSSSSPPGRGRIPASSRLLRLNLGSSSTSPASSPSSSGAVRSSVLGSNQPRAADSKLDLPESTEGPTRGSEPVDDEASLQLARELQEADLLEVHRLAALERSAEEYARRQVALDREAAAELSRKEEEAAKRREIERKDALMAKRIAEEEDRRLAEDIANAEAARPRPSMPHPLPPLPLPTTLAPLPDFVMHGPGLPRRLGESFGAGDVLRMLLDHRIGGHTFGGVDPELQRMALDVDSLDYDQLQALQERLGFVRSPHEGASAAAIDALPTTRFHKKEAKKSESASSEARPASSASARAPGAAAAGGAGDGSNSCCICLSDFDDGDEIRTLPCFHKFHADEIKTWLLKNNKCPICQTKVAAPP